MQTGLPTTAIDYRPALHNREGIGRVARELVRGLVAHEDAPRLVLFGGALRAPRVELAELGLSGAEQQVRLVAPRLPARLHAPLFALTGGADRRLGAGLVHHTQLRALPTRRAPATGMVYDLLFLGGGAGRLAARAARSMERRLYDLLPRLTRVQVTTEFVAAELEQRLGVDRGRIDVVPLGGDHMTRTPVPAAAVPREPYLLTVSRLDPRKGHRLALAAFERLVARGFDGRWLVVGPAGFGADELWAELSASPVAERIEWRRSVDDGELRQLYEHCLAFLFPSLAEGFGLPPIEALWCDAPVVSSRATCLGEVLGDAALLFDPHEPDEVASCLERIVSDQSLRSQLVERGRVQRERYTWRACADATLASWRRACAGSTQ